MATKMYKELVEVLSALVKFECACEELDTCSECVLRHASELCEGIPEMVTSIQAVLYHEC